MPDNNTIHRALAGDEKAQLECTDAAYALPCPFCAGEASIVWETDDDGDPCVHAQCAQCDCMSDGFYAYRSLEDAERRVLAAWNRRARVPEEDV